MPFCLLEKLKRELQIIGNQRNVRHGRVDLHENNVEIQQCDHTFVFLTISKSRGPSDESHRYMNRYFVWSKPSLKARMAVDFPAPISPVTSPNERVAAI